MEYCYDELPFSRSQNFINHIIHLATGENAYRQSPRTDMLKLLKIVRKFRYRDYIAH